MLTATKIQALKPAAKPHKVPDADGLLLLVHPSGALLWRFRYKAHGAACGPSSAVRSRERPVHFKTTGHRIGLTKAKPEFDIGLRRPAEARQSAENVWDKMWGGVSARRQKLFPNKPLGLDDGDPYGNRTTRTGPVAAEQPTAAGVTKVDFVQRRDAAKTHVSDVGAGMPLPQLDARSSPARYQGPSALFTARSFSRNTWLKRQRSRPCYIDAFPSPCPNSVKARQAKETSAIIG